MQIGRKYITPALAAGAAAVAIVAAPTAVATAVTPGPVDQACTAAVCDKPGNVQIDESAGSSVSGAAGYGNFHGGNQTGHGGGSGHDDGGGGGK
jgi:hypothetical protein